MFSAPPVAASAATVAPRRDKSIPPATHPSGWTRSTNWSGPGEVAEILGTTGLHACSGLVRNEVCRFGVAASQPWRLGVPDLLATGRAQLLTARTHTDIIPAL